MPRAKSRWLMGCGIGCGVVFLMFLVVGGFGIAYVGKTLFSSVKERFCVALLVAPWLPAVRLRVVMRIDLERTAVKLRSRRELERAPDGIFHVNSPPTYPCECSHTCVGVLWQPTIGIIKQIIGVSVKEVRRCPTPRCLLSSCDALSPVLSDRHSPVRITIENRRFGGCARRRKSLSLNPTSPPLD